MTKHIPLSLPLLFTLFLAGTSCEPAEKTAIPSSIDQSKIIVEAVQITEVQDYTDIIRNLDEYKNNLPDQAKTEVIFSFDVRKMTINDSVYYHLELWKTRLARIEESSIPTPEIRAYFRILPETKTILILDIKTKRFIDLDSKQGKVCLEKCMSSL